MSQEMHFVEVADGAFAFQSKKDAQSLVEKIHRLTAVAETTKDHCDVYITPLLERSEKKFATISAALSAIAQKVDAHKIVAVRFPLLFTICYILCCIAVVARR